MSGDSYFLILISKEGTKYRVYSKPISLKEIDLRTTKYDSKNQLINTIKRNCNIEDEIIDVEILRQPNKKKQKFIKEVGPLYKKDKNVLDADIIGTEFEIMAHNREFILWFINKFFAKIHEKVWFINKYSKVKNFAGYINTIENMIINQKNYFEELQHLVDMISSSYKGCRNIYLYMQKYKKQKEKSKTSKKETFLTDDEIKKYELMYLKEYERELLDLSDFNHYPELSPFDDVKIK